MFRSLRTLACALASAALFAMAGGGAAAAESGHRLILVEQPGCYYCIRWHEEIGPAYPNTEFSVFAPLRAEQLRDLPDDLTLDRKVLFTPTFVLVDAQGVELARLEGYPGQDFFWPLLKGIFEEQAGFEPAMREE